MIRVVFHRYILTFLEIFVFDNSFILPIVASPTVENILHELRVATDQYTKTLDLLETVRFFMAGVSKNTTVNLSRIKLGPLWLGHMHVCMTPENVQVCKCRFFYYSKLRRDTWYDW